MKYIFKWLTVPLFALFSTYIHAAPSVSVVFVLDESGSVSRSNFDLQTKGFQEALTALPLDGSVEVSVIGFSSSNSTIVDKMELTSATLTSVSDALANNYKNSGGTNMSGAINSSAGILLGSTAPSKVICLATDGSPNSQSSATLAANNAKNSGISLTPVGIGLGTSGKSFLDSIASIPPVPNPGDFTDFATVVTNVCVGVTKSALNIALTPTSVDFGVSQGSGQSQCSQQESISLTNRSNQIVSITNISIQGEDAENFQLLTALGQSFDSLTFPNNLPGLYNTALEVKLSPLSTPADSTYDASIVVSAIDENGISGDFSATLQAPVGNACLTFSAWDAQQVIGTIDENSVPYNKSGNILADDKGKFTESQLENGKRVGLVTDGNARLLLTSTTSVIKGKMRFEIITPSRTEARLGTLDYSSNNDGSTFVDVDLSVNTNGEGQASAILRAGEYFLGTAGEKEVAFSIRSCLLDDQNVCTSVEQQKTFRERRAPVVLIHGLWASPDSFNGEEKGVFKSAVPGLFDELSKNGLREVGTIKYNNYQGPTATMPASSKLLSGEIDTLCDKLIYNDQFACTRADLVGHSMGGLVARKFIEDNNHYRDTRNFQQGAVRRLITLGTPHLGSGFASLLMGRDDSGIRSCIRDERLLVKDEGFTVPLVNEQGDVQATIIRELQPSEEMTEVEKEAGYEVLANGYSFVNVATSGLAKIGNQVVTDKNGAINYLALGSAGLNYLNNNQQAVPTVGLVGNIGNNLLFNGFRGRHIEKVLRYTGCVADDLFLGEDSDGVVALSSARGRLGSSYTQEFPSVQHTGMGTNQGVIDWVLDIIDMPLTKYSKIVMNAKSRELKFMISKNNLPSLKNKPVKKTLLSNTLLDKVGEFVRSSALAMIGINTAYAQDIDSLQISVSNLTPVGGEEITISLDSSSDGLESIALQGDGIDLIDETAPYSWTTTVPNNAVGKFQYSVAAISELNILTSNTVEITVAIDASEIRSILFDPADRIVLHPGRSQQLKLVGQGNDGFKRDLTASALGTTYSENIVSGLTVTVGDSAVFSIDSEGNVYAQEPGEAEIVASFGTLSAIRRILVVSAEPDDADGDGLTDSQEQLLGTDRFNPDSDDNGIQDDIEVGSNPDAALDSDGDGIIDALESDTMVVEDENGLHISIKTSAGKITSAYSQPLADLPARSGELDLITMPLGALGFSVEELNDGQAIDVSLTFENIPAGIDSYLKYGAQLPQGDQANWYEFTDFDLEGNTITLHLVDNASGDSNPISGVISDPGGPGDKPNPTPVPTPNVEKDSGGSVGVWGLVFLMLVGMRKFKVKKQA